MENNLAAGIRIFDPIRPFLGVKDVRVEARTAFEQVAIAGPADEDVVLIPAE
ncbi:MAG: hypothetical protein ACREI1_10965 [Nitrospiraceae bacterium]